MHADAWMGEFSDTTLWEGYNQDCEYGTQDGTWAGRTDSLLPACPHDEKTSTSLPCSCRKALVECFTWPCRASEALHNPASALQHELCSMCIDTRHRRSYGSKGISREQPLSPACPCDVLTTFCHLKHGTSQHGHCHGNDWQILQMICLQLTCSSAIFQHSEQAFAGLRGPHGRHLRC